MYARLRFSSSLIQSSNSLHALGILLMKVSPKLAISASNTLVPQNTLEAKSIFSKTQKETGHLMKIRFTGDHHQAPGSAAHLNPPKILMHWYFLIQN